jgi:type VI secretion system protein ImpF
MKDRQNSRATILDRLVDLEPGVSKEPVQHRLYDIRQVKAMVVRDLENLLNTRRHILMVPASYKEVNNSVFMYGLGDFTSENPKSSPVRRQLRQDVERAISRFEPRLKNVTVRLEEDKERGHNLRFKISGLLVVEPETEPVSFDTYFDTNRGEYVIEQ